MTRSSDSPITIDFPLEIPTVRRGNHWLARAGPIELRLSNLDKTFWPESGYTKGDLLTYYFNVFPVMVPHLRDRPLTLKRMPDGVVGPYFYEKDAPSYTPDWMPTIDMAVGTEHRTVHALTVSDVASLLWVANLGCIDLHPLHATGGRQSASELRRIRPRSVSSCRLRERLRSRAAVEGGVRPPGGRCVPEDIGRDRPPHLCAVRPHSLVRRCSSLRCSRLPDTARAATDLTTHDWDVSKRSGKVFLDYGMNRPQASLSCAYSVRPEWNAPVSTPLAWDELGDVDPAEFTMATMLDRVNEAGDLFAPVLDPAGEATAKAITDLLSEARRK
jgi:bifunctional non-homologous end joining protein LigD